MAVPTTMKRNDTGPAFLATLRDAYGNAINLSGVLAVQFHMRDTRTKAVKVDAACTVVDAATGRISYAWDAADTDTAGIFEAEVEVTFSDGTVESFPNDGFQRVEVIEDLA